jgi:triacylglycerol lipase
MPQPEGVYCQSVGSVLKKAINGKFPLILTYQLVKEFDGPNDGLVGWESFQWGESYQLLEPEGRRGISHGDVIDMNRENIPGFDVREFYVQLVVKLKEKGF